MAQIQYESAENSPNSLDKLKKGPCQDLWNYKAEDRKSRITPQSRFLYGNFFHFMKIEKYAL